jgi:hypothetical protein
MRSFRIGAFSCACACALALATSPVRAEPIRIGARAGFTTAWLSEANLPIIGATAALLISIPVASGSLFLEPELAFSMKGGSWNGLDGGGEDKHYDYIEEVETQRRLHRAPREGAFLPPKDQCRHRGRPDRVVHELIQQQTEDYRLCNVTLRVMLEGMIRIARQTDYAARLLLHWASLEEGASASITARRKAAYPACGVSGSWPWPIHST